MSHLKTFVFFFILLFAFFLPIYSQENTCRVGDTVFDCPDYFSKVDSGDTSMALFKYKEDLELYFFVHSKGRDFEPSDIEMTVKKIFGLETDDTVEWNIISEPFTMGMRTKYRPMVRASYGLSSNKLLEVKGFIFEFNGKDFVAGYISDWSNDPQTNREKFRSGQAAGDNAAGCNAVVTAFNSVSHEFKEKSQHCYLTALKAQ